MQWKKIESNASILYILGYYHNQKHQLCVNPALTNTSVYIKNIIIFRSFAFQILLEIHMKRHKI